MMNSASGSTPTDLDVPDLQLQTSALSSRELDGDMVLVQDSGLWGYLQPVFESPLTPYVDFPKRGLTRTHFLWSVGVSDDRVEDIMEFSRRETRPTRIRVLCEEPTVKVNDIVISQGETSVVKDGDRITVSHITVSDPSQAEVVIHDYYYRNPSAPRFPGTLSEHYDRGRLIGSGGFSDVFLVSHRETRRLYVSKRIKKQPEQPSYEISYMRRLDHPNVCSLKEVFFDSRGRNELVMEFCRYGDLYEYINAGQWRGLAPDTAREITLQICQGMAYVHSRGIVHRDLKPENILLASLDPVKIKITDFGLAKAPGIDDLLISAKGTRIYAAPEVFSARSNQESYDRRVDSWSVGIVVYIMLTGSGPPFAKTGEDSETYVYDYDWMPARALGKLEEIGYYPEGNAYQFCKSLLKVDRDERPTLEEALGLPWLVEDQGRDEVN